MHACMFELKFVFSNPRWCC